MSQNSRNQDSYQQLDTHELETVTGAGSDEGDICRAGSSAYYGAIGAIAGSLGGPIGAVAGGAIGTFAGSLIGAKTCKP